MMMGSKSNPREPTMMSSGHHSSDEDDSKTNLIVNYLPQNMSDNEFRNLFGSIGVIKSCRIIRHKPTGYSYGFGFVDFTRAEDAQKAIEVLNGLAVQHKKIKVAYARPAGEGIKQANLYIKNIPGHLKEDDLARIFRKYGNIIQCRILNDGNGGHKGVGFILFDLHRDAEKAINDLNGRILTGSTEPLEIKYASDNMHKVRMTNYLNKGRTPSYQGEYYDQQAYSQSDDFGLQSMSGISYFDSASVGPIRQQIPPVEEPSSSNYYSCANNTSSSSNSSSRDGYILFIYNIGAETQETDMYELFSTYGRVAKCNVVRKGDASRGYGFVTMSSYNEALTAIHALNGYNFQGKRLQVSFKK